MNGLDYRLSVVLPALLSIVISLLAGAVRRPVSLFVKPIRREAEQQRSTVLVSG
jgi:hypothetical protein